MNEAERIPQSKTTMVFAVLFLGLLGVHRYMMGYKNWWLMTVTFGGLGVWALYDLVMIVTGKMKMADGEELW